MESEGRAWKLSEEGADNLGSDGMRCGCDIGPRTPGAGTGWYGDDRALDACITNSTMTTNTGNKKGS